MKASPTPRVELVKRNVTIERAVPDDAKAILTIKREGWLRAYINESQGITRQDIQKKFTDEDLLAGITNWQKGLARNKEGLDDTRAVFVARVHDKVVGFSAPRIEEDGQRRLGAMYMDKNFESRGIGTMLLKQALLWHGNHDVYLHVVSYNQRAILFYELHGFIKTGIKTEEELDKKQGYKLLPEIEMVHKATH